ncbi:hypothetical protein JT358_05485 [Micrococcales bacterium 31B]|nr:hypothetical protein [Micrococcales bacterium 31B]
MPGVADPQVIDVIAETDGGDVLLLMSEGRDWGGDDHVTALRAKLNTYMNFIKQGTLVEEYPQYAGRVTYIALFCREAPSGPVTTFLQFVTAKNAELGVPFAVEVKPEMFDGEKFTGGGMLG